MNPSRPNAEQVFHEARKLTDPQQRDDYLKQACAGDPALLARIDALLQAEAEAGGFLKTADGPGADAPTRADPRGERPGEMIGRYKLLQLIGEGGFGSVWMAEQREPVKRRVALKIIKLGMDTKQVIARFEAERQALAMMDHPNIARVLDAGATDTGRPYFAMEYIRGVPILEYCDTERLDTAARLELFISVCHAIQHAHQKGIIHRDIKPGNVLITLHDGVPVPKVIDFGIAKATSAELTTKTLFTQHRQMIGTPAYMSPEQAEMSGLDIDTRADIYSLGVLLYELLTGATPFDPAELMSKGFAEMMRIIREVEPDRPSTRLSTLGDSATRTAELRRAGDPRKLGTLLRGDLDWIVMKCLEKDRSRRYETANGLAADIRRHLDDEPVTASPPSAAYRLRKLVRRNRAAFLSGAAIFLVLTLGAAAATWGLFATRAEAARAQRELARASAVNTFMDDLLGSADPHQRKGADYTVRQLLDDFGRTIGNQFQGQPLVEASVRSIVGNAYLHLGLAGEAEAHFQVALDLQSRELGPSDPRTLWSRNRLLMVMHDHGEYVAAERLARDLLEEAGGRAGPDWLQDSLRGTIADLLVHQGRYDEAEDLFRELLRTQTEQFGENSHQTMRTMNNLAVLHIHQGRSDDATALFERLVPITRHVFGDDHPETFDTFNLLAVRYTRQGRLAEAEPLYREALAGRRGVLGPDHADTLLVLSNLANCYERMGRLSDARPLRRELLQAELEAARRPDAGASMLNNLAWELLVTRHEELQDPAAALRLAERSCALETAENGSRLWMFLDTLALAQRLTGDIPASEATRERSLAAIPGDARSLNEAAWNLLTYPEAAMRDAASALPLAQQACAQEEAAGGGNLWMYLDTLALAQHMTGDPHSTLQSQRRAIELMPPGESDPEMLARLAEYEAAAAASPPATAAGGEDR